VLGVSMVENSFKDLDFYSFQVAFDVVAFLLIDLLNGFYMGHLTCEEAYFFLGKYRFLVMDLCPCDQLEDLKKISVLNVIESFFISADLLPEYASILYDDRNIAYSGFGFSAGIPVSSAIT
jgi:hypothetical protein